MIKKLIIPLFLLIIAIIVYLMVREIVLSTEYSLEMVMKSVNNPFLNNSLRNLTTEEINNLSIKYKVELTELEFLKSSSLSLIFICIIWLIIIISIKPDFSIKKFDSFTIIIAYISLVFTLFAVFQMLIGGHFEFGHNATIRIRITIELIIMLINPLIFYTIFKLNKFEIEKNMHQGKWITNFAIVLTVLSGLIAFFIGIGLLLTPDVSSFKN